MVKQKTHNTTVKGEGRKKFRAALSEAIPMELEPTAPVAASAATLSIGAAARARDPNMQLASAVVREAVSAALAAYAAA